MATKSGSGILSFPIVGGPDRADLQNSCFFGKEVLFHFGEKDCAKFVVPGVETSLCLRSWTISKAVLLNLDQSPSLREAGAKPGDEFFGEYSVLSGREGVLKYNLSKRKMIYFFVLPEITEVENFDNDIQPDVLLQLSQGSSIVLSGCFVCFSRNTKTAIIEGLIKKRSPADVYNGALKTGKTVKVFLDFILKEGIIMC